MTVMVVLIALSITGWHGGHDAGALCRRRAGGGPARGGGDDGSASNAARSIAPDRAAVALRRHGEFVVATVTTRSALLPGVTINEIRNLPGYEGAQKGTSSTLRGFDAVQIGGTYIKNGVNRSIAQKTVVIPGQDGLYVLQLNADSTQDHKRALTDATRVIDEQTTITS